MVECKAEKVDINIKDYYQGESYARAVGCEFFIAHNARYTSVFKLVPGVPGDFVPINEIPKAEDWGDAKRIEEIKSKLRVFNRREFQDLLFKCHSILRDVHKMDPGRAFNTISKILFVKMYVERSGRLGTFRVEYLDRRARERMPNEPLVHDRLFDLRSWLNLAQSRWRVRNGCRRIPDVETSRRLEPRLDGTPDGKAQS